jgi:hypothetical protein
MDLIVHSVSNLADLSADLSKSISLKFLSYTRSLRLETP